MATRREASSSGGMSEFQDETENWRDSTVASQLLAPKQGMRSAEGLLHISVRQWRLTFHTDHMGVEQK